MEYKVEGKGRNWKVLDSKGNEIAKFTARSAAQLHVKRLEQEEQAAATTENPTSETAPETTETEQQESTTDQNVETPPEPPKSKKLSGSDFAMFFFCEHPEATEADLRKALDEANIKMAQSTLETWQPFMRKIFDKLDELGWQRPEAN